MSQVLLEARDISLGYPREGGWQAVLAQFDLQLAPGEVVTILGPSGSASPACCGYWPACSSPAVAA